MANLVDELNAVALKVARPKAVADLAFRRKSPVLAQLRADAMPHSGGAFIQNTFLYGKTTGGSFTKGSTFSLVQNQILDITKFDMRYYQQSDVQFLEELKVEIGKGDHVLYDKAKIHQQAMLLTMNEMLSVDLYRHGQTSTTGVSDNRNSMMNGLAEALNNGVDNGWDGNYFTAYGKQTRNGTIGSALNSTPYFGGNADGSAGPITYSAFLEQYIDACNGDWEPNLISMNKALWSYILERMQPQQMWNETNPHWGGQSFRFMNAKVARDEYAPSSRYGVSDPKTGSWLTSTFTSVNSPTTNSNLPAATTVTVGETLWYLNTKTFQIHISSDPLFQFGFTGYKEAQNSIIVAGQLLLAINLLCQYPYANKQAYGFNS